MFHAPICLGFLRPSTPLHIFSFHMPWYSAQSENSNYGEEEFFFFLFFFLFFTSLVHPKIHENCDLQRDLNELGWNFAHNSIRPAENFAYGRVEPLVSCIGLLGTCESALP